MTGRKPLSSLRGKEGRFFTLPLKWLMVTLMLFSRVEVKVTVSMGPPKVMPLFDMNCVAAQTVRDVSSAAVSYI